MKGRKNRRSPSSFSSAATATRRFFQADRKASGDPLTWRIVDDDTHYVHTLDDVWEMPIHWSPGRRNVSITTDMSQHRALLASADCMRDRFINRSPIPIVSSSTGTNCSVELQDIFQLRSGEQSVRSSLRFGGRLCRFRSSLIAANNRDAFLFV